MAQLNFGKSVTLIQAAMAIATTPQVRYLLVGEPGIGKSSILELVRALREKFLNERAAQNTNEHTTQNTNEHTTQNTNEHTTQNTNEDNSSPPPPPPPRPYQNVLASYSDVGTLDLGDIVMPTVDHEAKVTRYYPSARFNLHLGQPVVIMLDEFTKGSPPVQNMLHPLLERTNPRLGDVPLPEGTIVFLTGNLSSDGVGDNMKAHSLNRLVRLHIRKPDADEWLAWATEHGIEAVVQAWVKQYPHCLASYLDNPNMEGSKVVENPYIYSPRAQQLSFVSPRSLEAASYILKSRHLNDRDATLASLSGAIGEAAARDMQAYVEYQDELPSWKSILSHPGTTHVPVSPGACSVLIYGALAKVTAETFDAFMEYLSRFSPEWQACFMLQITSSPSKQAIAFRSKRTAEWMSKNADIL